MTGGADDGGLYRAVGKIEGQLRELVHGQNNMNQKIDGLAHQVAVSSNIPTRVDDLEQRVGALETDRDKRDGAVGIVGWLLRSPVVSLVVGAALAVWAMLGSNR